MRALLRLLATTSVLIAAPPSIHAQTAQVPEELRDFYASNAGLLSDLVRTATDTGRPVADRLAAFRRVRLSFSHAALDPALLLVADENAALAVEAARFLAAQITMMNHGAASGHDHQAADDPVARAREALRHALSDRRQEVRSIAATTLASMGDQVALERLSEAYQKGQIKDGEAVSYLTLAEAGVGASYVEKVLQNGSVAARSEAISYLAPLPQYRTRIRDQYLLDDKSNTDLRATAARVLAKSDPQFGTYAFTLTSEPNLPIPVFESIVTGVVQQGGAALDRGRIDALSKTVDRFQAARPGADLDSLKIQLRTLRPL